MKILYRSRTGAIARPAIITSRTFSTWVWVAASISRTSMSRPSAISTHASQVPHGSAVAPCSQLSARAKMRAVVVFPTPRGPAKTKAGASRAVAIALRSVWRHAALPDNVVESLRAILPGEYLIGHVANELTGQSGRVPKGGELHRGPEEPAAHVSVYLALLPSGPDAVRRLRLHRVRAAVQPDTTWVESSVYPAWIRVARPDEA